VDLCPYYSTTLFFQLLKISLTNSFVEDTAKAAQWGGFIRKNRLKNVPQDFVEVVTAIAAFLKPIAKQLAAGLVFKAT
jgi:hypothetical protein